MLWPDTSEEVIEQFANERGRLGEEGQARRHGYSEVFLASPRGRIDSWGPDERSETINAMKEDAMDEEGAVEVSAGTAQVRTLTYTAAFRCEEDWWWAQAVEVPEAFGQGRTLEEARGSLAEAVQGALRLRADEGEAIPPSGQVTVGPVSVPRP